MPMPQLNDNTSQLNNIENNSPVTNRNPNWQHESFQLPKGWALKEKQTFGGKGTGKRMTKKGWISRYAVALKDQATKTALQNKK
ncbi:7089_t:CDS:2 [Funneliformis caledonium]|uniref:7089_t:CDS:1 n=1 Tax=Funneliformis caledonium TaxID=1117310 RepID=A0A9N9HP50_9GLOM|nr:7089_t:CDS:2 [Funneliformis caledonium]